MTTTPSDEVQMITSRCAEGNHHLCAQGKHISSLDYTIPCDCECHQPQPFDRAAFVNAVDQIVSHLERAQGVVEHEHLRLHHDFNSHFTKALLAANQVYRMLNP